MYFIKWLHEANIINSPLCTSHSANIDHRVFIHKAVKSKHRRLLVDPGVSNGSPFGKLGGLEPQGDLLVCVLNRVASVADVAVVQY